MILVLLKGGLGNQMFQYAAARSLATRTGADVALDLSFLEARPANQDWTPRDYALHCYSLPARIADAGGRDRLLRPPWHWKLARKLGLAGRRVLRERSARFDPRFLALGSEAYLDGYFQSEKYFAPIADTLRSEFVVAPAAAQRALLDELGAHESVSVHVRRGDYVGNPTAAAYHGVCSPAYYRSAAAHLQAHVAGLRYYVFSDDPAWARANLELPGPTVFVDPPSASPAQDLQLMRSCRHHIVANSSFSWWGAWLNPRPDKRVVAPRPWFMAADHDDADLVPSSWTRIDAGLAAVQAAARNVKMPQP
jgi:hypothetical protein